MLRIIFFLSLFSPFASAAESGEPLTILSINSASHEVRVKPSVEITQADMDDYEIHLEQDEEGCELEVKEFRLRDWVLDTEGCDEKPLTTKSQIWLRLKEKSPVKAKRPEEKPVPTDMGFNISVFYNVTDTYSLTGDFESAVDSGKLDIRGKVSSSPGFSLGLTFPVFRKFELELGIGYEASRNIRQEDGKVGSSSFNNDFPDGEPTLSFGYLFGNFRFYLPKREFYFFAGGGLGDAMGSSELAKMNVVVLLQGGAGYHFSEGWSTELATKVFSGIYQREGTVGAVNYTAKEAAFSMVGIVAALKYKF